MSESFLSGCWAPGIFDKKVLFCPGGSGDICSAQVKALVYLGANACIVGRNQEKAERVAKEIAATRQGSKVLAYKADVRDLKALEGAAAHCFNALGSIDFVIAGAAGNFLAPFLQLSERAFKAVVDIDLFGAFNTSKATAQYLLKSAGKRQGGGRIVFISSTTQYTGAALVTHGAVAKAGIDALSSQLAIELGPRGITSNVIAPGPIAGTEGVKRLISTDTKRQIPLGNFGTLKDMGDAAVYIFSEAGSYVNGATLVVDGGAWRVNGGQAGGGFEYPSTVLSDEPFSKALEKASHKL